LNLKNTEDVMMSDCSVGVEVEGRWGSCSRGTKWSYSQGTLRTQASAQRSAVQMKGRGILVRECDRCKIKILLLFPFDRTR
jgi:hypothetical protein